VLLTGESGSGKEIFARYMHRSSHRREGPFVAMPVGSIARENSEVELFGSEEGDSTHYGRLEQANGGILFLQGVADMDMDTQSRLHSAIEGQSFMRVGGVDPVKVDVCIYASTHKDLELEVKVGNFREDLYYHLNVVPLRIPALREHLEDIPELLAFYVDYFVSQENLSYRRFSVAAQNRLRNYTWPGNVRELKNLVQRLLILGTGEDVGLDEVENSLSTQIESKASVSGIPSGAIDLPLREAREQFEREYLTHQLQVCNGSVGKLAKLVGMERTNLYRKLRALGVDVKQV
jgi:DNA-binding NtrC family response regulator